jgi:hypothetical protein
MPSDQPQPPREQHPLQRTIVPPPPSRKFVQVVVKEDCWTELADRQQPQVVLVHTAVTAVRFPV